MPRKKQNTDAASKRAGARRRAGILKTVALVAVGLLLALPALFVNSAIGYLPVFAYVFALLLSYGYIQVLKRNLEFSSNNESAECTRCDELDFKLTVKNKSLLPAIRVQALFFMSDLFGGEGASDVHNIALGPHQEKVFEFGVRFDHIGTYEVGIKEVTVLDLLGVFSSVHENDHLMSVRVHPRVFDVGQLPVAKDAAIEAKKTFTTVINDGMDYSGTREYRWGDPIKSIHWKLSARMNEGEYLTRLYETNANPGMAIIADFDAPAYTSEELMSIYDAVVECAFSVERYADRNGFDAELLFEDKAKTRRRYTTPLAGRHGEILERMPQIFSPGTGKDALGLIQAEMNSVFAQSNMIVISSVITKGLVEALVAAKVGKRAPILFAIIPSTVDEEQQRSLRKTLALLGAAGINYRVLSDAEQLGQGV